MNRPAISALVLGFVLGCAHTPGSISASRARIEPDQALDHVRYLASDELEGRGVETPGLRKAADYIAAQFRRDGLEPLGPGGSYEQPFEVPVGGPIRSADLALGERVLARGDGFDVLPWSSSGQIGPTPVLFVGYGITDPSHGRDDYAGLDVHGKIALCLRRLPEGQGLDEKFADVREKIANAKRHGAAALILVNRVQDTDDLGPSRNAAEDRGLLALHAQRELAEHLMGVPLPALEAARPGLVAPAPVGIAAQLERKHVTVANLVGLLRGSDPALAKEYVLVGSHYDHLGKGFPQAWNPHSCKGAQPGMVFHGADDNASGTAAMLEIAEAFAGAPSRPKRSIVFAAFGAEEMGLLGSAFFTEHPPLPMGDLVAMLNLDMVGRLRDNLGVTLEGSATAPEWRDLIARANVEHLRITGSRAIMEDSDHAPFYNHGRPVLFFFTGLHGEYHCYTDTIDRINAAGMAKVARLAQRVAQEVADAPAAHAGLTFAQVPIAHHAGGSFSGPRLGIAPDYATQGGLGVAGVIDGGAAAKAGIRTGDVITMLGDREVSGIEDYMTALAAHKAGETVDVVVRRGAERVMLRATLEGANIKK